MDHDACVQMFLTETVFKRTESWLNVDSKSSQLLTHRGLTPKPLDPPSRPQQINSSIVLARVSCAGGGEFISEKVTG